MNSISLPAASRRPFFLKRAVWLVLVAAATLFLQNCSPKVDARAVQLISGLQKSLPKVVNMATMPYDKHEKDVKAANKSLDDAAKYAASRKKNKDVAAMYSTLKDELVAPFFEKWKAEKSLGADYVKEFGKQLSESLGRIANAENPKKK